MSAVSSDAGCDSEEIERFDVIIVGAGISGIGSATLLRKHCPDLSFVVLDAMESFGGTWLMHKYPGTRSDSDLFTFGRTSVMATRSNPPNGRVKRQAGHWQSSAVI